MAKKESLLDIKFSFYSEKCPNVHEVNVYGKFKSEPHIEIGRFANQTKRTFETRMFRPGIYKFSGFAIPKTDHKLFTIFNGVGNGYFELKSNGEVDLIDFQPLPSEIDPTIQELIDGLKAEITALKLEIDNRFKSIENK